MEKIEVEAYTISPYQISYICPNCFSSYKKNGEPTKRATNIVHLHGNSEGTKENHTIIRSSHCSSNPYEVRICITDKTRRIKYKSY